MSVTDDTGAEATSSEKDVLLIVASVSMALATIALILIVRLLERCLPDAEREESARAQEKKAQKRRELIERHTHLLTYSQWISKMREKYGLPLSLSRSSSRLGSSRLDIEKPSIPLPLPQPLPIQGQPAQAQAAAQPTSLSISVSSTAPQPSSQQGWSEDCAVCLTEFSADERIREISFCSHIFHEECLHGWFVKSKKPVCPLCRYNLQNSRIEEEEDTALPPTTAAAPVADQTTQPPSSSSNQRPPLTEDHPGIPADFLTGFV